MEPTQGDRFEETPRQLAQRLGLAFSDYLLLSRALTHRSYLNEHPDFVGTTLSGPEAWKLAELMKRFYTLRAAADTFHRGGAHISGPSEYLKREDIAETINHEILPLIFEDVYKLLSPA